MLHWSLKLFEWMSITVTSNGSKTKLDDISVSPFFCILFPDFVCGKYAVCYFLLLNLKRVF